MQVKRSLESSGILPGADVGPVLRQDLHDLEVSPAGGRVDGLPEVVVLDVGGHVVLKQELHHRQVPVGGGYVQGGGAGDTGLLMT